jgi:hypothetical protein
MKYEITQEQANELMRVLGEVPAKLSLVGIRVLEGLKPMQEPASEKKEEV